MLNIVHEREPQFKAIPALVQKYYLKMGNPGVFGGIYICDTRESLAESRKSELAATIAKAYGAIEPPSVEIVDIMFDLR